MGPAAQQLEENVIEDVPDTEGDGEVAEPAAPGATRENTDH